MQSTLWRHGRVFSAHYCLLTGVPVPFPRHFFAEDCLTRTPAGKAWDSKNCALLSHLPLLSLLQASFFFRGQKSSVPHRWGQFSLTAAHCPCGSRSERKQLALAPIKPLTCGVAKKLARRTALRSTWQSTTILMIKTQPPVSVASFVRVAFFTAIEGLLSEAASMKPAASTPVREISISEMQSGAQRCGRDWKRVILSNGSESTSDPLQSFFEMRQRLDWGVYAKRQKMRRSLPSISSARPVARLAQEESDEVVKKEMLVFCKNSRPFTAANVLCKQMRYKKGSFDLVYSDAFHYLGKDITTIFRTNRQLINLI